MIDDIDDSHSSDGEDELDAFEIEQESRRLDRELNQLMTNLYQASVVIDTVLAAGETPDSVSAVQLNDVNVDDLMQHIKSELSARGLSTNGNGLGQSPSYNEASNNLPQYNPAPLASLTVTGAKYHNYTYKNVSHNIAGYLSKINFDYMEDLIEKYDSPSCDPAWKKQQEDWIGLFRFSYLKAISTSADKVVRIQQQLSEKGFDSLEDLYVAMSKLSAEIYGIQKQPEPSPETVAAVNDKLQQLQNHEQLVSDILQSLANAAVESSEPESAEHDTNQAQGKSEQHVLESPEDVDLSPQVSPPIASTSKNQSEQVHTSHERHSKTFLYKKKRVSLNPITKEIHERMFKLRMLLSHDKSLPELLNNNDNMPLLEAISTKQTMRALTLLKRGANTASRDRYGNTALHLAARSGLVDVMKELLRRDRSLLEAVNNNDDTPLLRSIWNGQPACALTLLEQGASTSCRNKQGDTALHLAAAEGQIAVMVELLRRDNSLLEAVSNHDNTPLLLSIWNQQPAATLTLLERGASTTCRNKQGNTVLHLAAIKGQTTVMEELLRQDDSLLDAVNNNDDTPLLVSIWDKQPAAALALLERGASTTCRNKQGNTALHLAAIKGQTAVMEELLHLDQCLLEAASNNDDTPLLLSIWHDQPAAALALLERGASTTYRDKQGNTALHLAVMKGQIAVMEELLRRDDSLLDAVNNDDEIPLFSSILSEQPAAVFALLERGASTAFRDKQGKTALHLAAAEGQTAVMEELLRRDVSLLDAASNDDGTPLLLSIWCKQPACALTLLERGASTSCRNKQGDTALHLAVIKGQTAVMEELLRRDDSLLEAANNNGYTPLLIAIENQSESCALSLLKINDINCMVVNKYRQTALLIAANRGLLSVSKELIARVKTNFLNKLQEYVNHKRRYGNTALHDATAEGNLYIVQLLLENGADIDSRNENGQTACLRAAWNKYTTVERYLIKSRAEATAGDNYGCTPALAHQILAALDAKEPEVLKMHFEQLTGLLCTIRNGSIKLTDEQVDVLCQGLRENKSTNFLCLERQNITDVGAKHIAELLKQNGTITEIILAGNQITDVGAEYIYNSLQENSTLKKLDLTRNKIDQVTLDKVNMLLFSPYRYKAVEDILLEVQLPTFRDAQPSATAVQTQLGELIRTNNVLLQLREQRGPGAHNRGGPPLAADSRITYLRQQIRSYRNRHVTTEDTNRLRTTLLSTINQVMVDNTSLATKVELIKTMVVDLDVLSLDTINAGYKVLVQRMKNELDKSDFRQLFSVLSNSIVDLKVYNEKIQAALEHIFDDERFVNLIRSGTFTETDKLLTNLINNPALAQQAPSSRYEFFAKVLFKTLQHDKTRLEDILGAIEFEKQNSSTLCNTLYRVFILDNENVENKRRFIEALVDSLQINYFQSEEVVEGGEYATVDIVNEVVNHNSQHHLINQIIDKERTIFQRYRLKLVSHCPDDEEIDNESFYIFRQKDAIGYAVVDSTSNKTEKGLVHECRYNLIASKKKPRSIRPYRIYLYLKRKNLYFKVVNQNEDRIEKYRINKNEDNKDDLDQIAKIIESGGVLTSELRNYIYSITAQYGFRRFDGFRTNEVGYRIGSDARSFESIHRALKAGKNRLDEKDVRIIEIFSNSKGFVLASDNPTNTHLFLSLVMLWVSKNIRFSKYPDELTWLRLLFHFGNNTSMTDQIELIKKIKGDIGCHRKIIIFNDLAEALSNYHRYFYNNRYYSDQYHELYLYLTEVLVKIARDVKDRGIASVSEMIIAVSKHFTSVDKDWLNKIFFFEKGKHLGGYTSGLDAVRSLFRDVVQNDDPNSWLTDSLSDKAFFLYSYAKYPLHEYQDWYVLSNWPNCRAGYVTKEYIHDLFHSFESKGKQLTGCDALPSVGFKSILNSQTAAILAAINPPIGSNHFFAKVGTGQGKSLITAMIAMHYATKGRRVHIFTVSDHLARRDHAKFKSLFEAYGLKSLLVDPAEFGDSGSVPKNDTNIAYAAMDNFFSAISNNFNRRYNADFIFNEMDVFDFFDQDVVILDEFDSIIFERHLFGNFVYDQAKYIGFGDVTREDLSSEYAFKKKLCQNKDIRSFFRKLKKHGMYGMYTNWFNSNKNTWNERFETTDALGAARQYLGGTFYEITNGKLFVKSMNLDRLAVLRKYKRVIGLSGSIDLENIKKFQQFFEVQDNTYLETPPFYGSVDKNNVEITRLSAPRNDERWLEVIKHDIHRALDGRQPILVFADKNNQSEWDAVYDLIESISTERGCSMQSIAREKDLDTKLKKACQPGMITLASDIVGRGADFVVQQSVMRQCRGLHVCITYYPSKDNEKDERKLIQMKGRTARMNNTGTHSVITKNEDDLSLGKTEFIKVEPNREKYHTLLREVLKVMSSIEREKVVVAKWKSFCRNWLLFNLFLSDAKVYPEKLSDPKIKNAPRWLLKSVLGYYPSKAKLLSQARTQVSTNSNGFFKSAEDTVKPAENAAELIAIGKYHR